MVPASPSLLDMPRELRNEIYSQDFFKPPYLRSRNIIDVPVYIPGFTQDPSTEENLQISDEMRPFGMLDPLCNSSTRLYWEATPYYLESVTLCIKDATPTTLFSAWLDKFGTEGWKAIRSVKFENFGTYEIDHQFLARCPNLTFLFLRFSKASWEVLVELVKRRTGDISSLEPTQQEWTRLFAAAFGLDRVFDLLKLETLAISVWRDDSHIYSNTCCIDTLSEWFTSGLENRGRAWIDQGGFCGPSVAQRLLKVLC